MVALGYQAASGLAAVHASGWVAHRDIVLRKLRLGDAGRLRILDCRTAQLTEIGIRGAHPPAGDWPELLAPEGRDNDAATEAEGAPRAGRSGERGDQT